MTSINVSKNNHEQLIEQGYGLFTKTGKAWMCKGGNQRINWSKIEVFGNVIECLFGKFTFIKHNVKEKIHYWLLKDEESGKYYDIKRDQVRKNQKLNSDWEVKIEVREIEEINTLKITEIFPMPLLIEHKTVRQVLEEYGYKYISQHRLDLFETSIEELDNEDIVEFIMGCVTDRKLRKNLYHEMLRLFHPDMNLYPDNNVVIILNSWFE